MRTTNLHCSLWSGLCKESKEIHQVSVDAKSIQPFKGWACVLWGTGQASEHSPWVQQHVNGSERMVRHVYQIIIVLAKCCLSWSQEKQYSRREAFTEVFRQGKQGVVNSEGLVGYLRWLMLGIFSPLLLSSDISQKVASSLEGWGCARWGHGQSQETVLLANAVPTTCNHR